MSISPKTTPERMLVVRLVEEGYDKKTWHGTNLKGTIRRVTPEQATWRPKPGRRNIAEIVVHCAYWKYAVRRRMRGDKRGSFVLKGSNWFDIPSRLNKTQWREYVQLLETTHRELVDTLTTISWTRLADGPGGGGKKPAAQVFGVAMHDVYHAGQIQTIKALHKAAGSQ